MNDLLQSAYLVLGDLMEIHVITYRLANGTERAEDFRNLQTILENADALRGMIEKELANA